MSVSRRVQVKELQSAIECAVQVEKLFFGC